jgi:hypothetical protein
MVFKIYQNPSRKGLHGKGQLKSIGYCPLNGTVFESDLPLSRDFWEKGSSAVLDTVPLIIRYSKFTYP